MQVLAYISLPNSTRIESAVRPDSDRTYWATFFTPSAPSASPNGAILPVRPSAMVVLIVAASRHHWKVPAVRLGKPREPAPSDAWHCAQLFRKSFCPIASASGILRSASTSVDANFL